MAPRATPTMVPEPTPAALFLNIDTKLGSVDGEMLVSGRTLPDSAVVIYTDSDETNVQSDSTGSFEGTLLVSPEDQYIHAAVFAADGQEKTTTLELVQEEEVLGESTQERATTEEDSMDSESAPEISRTLQEPENRAPDKRRGEPYRNTDRERYQSESEDVPSLTAEQDRKETKEMREERIREFIRVSTPSASTIKEIKRGIIEIRKFLTQDASKEARIAQAIKVLRITAREASAPAQLKRHAVSGVIVSLSEGSITIAHAIQRDRRFTVYYNADTKITAGDATEGSLPVLAEGLRVAVVGETEGDVLLAKRIHVIPGKATGIGKRITPATGSGSMYSTPSATVTSGTTSSP